MQRRCIGDILKRPRVCGPTGRPYVVLLCVGMRDATGKCDAAWTSLCRVQIIWSIVSPVCIANRDKQTHFKRHFRVPCARYAGGIRSGEECVLVKGGGTTRQTA